VKIRNRTINLLPLPEWGLPGYKIRIRCVSRAQMAAFISRDRKLPVSKVPDGTWNANNDTLYICNDLTPKEALRVFLHEMRHVFADWSLWQQTSYEEILKSKAVKVEED
jgi:hypothetical protein